MHSDDSPGKGRKRPFEPTASSGGQTEVPLADEQTDAELMRRLAEGRVETLEEVYVRYGRMVHSVLCRHGPGLSAADVDDLGQEVMVTLLETAPNCRDASKLRSWLCGIAVRKARDLAHQRRGRWFLLERFWHPDTVDTSSHQRVEARNCVEKALQSLPEAQRQALLLQAVEGFTGDEIAEILGVQPKTIWTRLHRARQAILRAEEEDELLALPAEEAS